MLKDSQLGKDLWGKAIATHIYIHNRRPSSILPDNVTPYERIFGHQPSFAHLRVFGSKCYIKIADETMLGSKATPSMWWLTLTRGSSGLTMLFSWRGKQTDEAKTIPLLSPLHLSQLQERNLESNWTHRFSTYRRGYNIHR